MTTLAEFAEGHGITAAATYVGTEADGGVYFDVWAVKLTMEGTDRTMATMFHMGIGHNGMAPTVVDVLSSFTADAAGIENAGGFEEWADEYGYDTDSRKAEDTYNATRRQTDQLAEFLGEFYDTALWDTDPE
jgi:hypothetical protein